MYEIFMIILSRVLIVLVGFWFYRQLSVWHGFQYIVIGRNGLSLNMASKGQKGFVSLRSIPDHQKRKSTKKVPLEKIKAPWGW